jgi:hypothetical protein
MTLKKIMCWLLTAAGLAMSVAAAEDTAPQVAEFNFQSPTNHPLPDWIAGFEQEGGQFVDSPRAWVVEKGVLPGVGRLVVTLNRPTIAHDLALGLAQEYYENTDRRHIPIRPSTKSQAACVWTGSPCSSSRIDGSEPAPSELAHEITPLARVPRGRGRAC